MLIELVICATSALLFILAIQVVLNFVRQYRLNKFFKINSPNLPVVDELCSIYGGHANTVIYNPKNIKLIDSLHKKYGETFGLLYCKHPGVSTLDLDLIKTMIFDEPNSHINRPPADIPFDGFEEESIAFARDKKWHRLRQACAPALTSHKVRSPNVVSELEEIIDKFVGSIEERLDANEKEKGLKHVIENGDDIFHRYTLALVFKSFYKQDNLIDFKAKKDHYVEMIGETARSIINPLFVLSIVFPVLKPFVTFILMNFHPQGKLRREIMMFIRQQTKLNLMAKKEFESAKKNSVGEFNPDNYYLSDGTKFSRNLSDHFIDQFHEGRVTTSEYFQTSFFTFFAANKTSADTLTVLIHHIATYPRIQEKLRESILAEGVESEYLTWTINETLRLHPPAPVGSSRILTREYINKEGVKIPANMIVFTPTYSIHRLEKYWGEDAQEYRPERWADSNNFHPCQYLPFGLGKRNCLGKHYAMLEIKMLLNVLLRKFKFERSALTKDDNQFQAPAFIFTIFDEPHYIKISRLSK